MSKKKTSFICSSCGSGFVKWHGRCPDCEEWNTLVQASPSEKSADRLVEAVSLEDIPVESVKPYPSGISEFDLVCGGGVIPGSVILVGGEPGIGKSTLALQVAGRLGALYISGEESPSQIKSRSLRIKIKNEDVKISRNTSVEEIIELLNREKPGCVIVDSIQTVYSSDIPGVPGSVSQIRESSAKLAEAARKLSVTLILIGHITKEGSIAGPKILEHIVDTVLYFEGDYTRDFRILRCFKNRFGSVNEIGIFRMTAEGLKEVSDKNRIFLNPFSSDSPGSAVSASIEGSRPILFEVQSLASFTSFANPRRMSDGFDLNRLILICAVLEKHAGLKLSSFDVFLNVSGGFRISDTSADLAVAMAITSSIKDVPVNSSTGFAGEIALSGEIRPVSQCHRRLLEFKLAGFTDAVVSHSDLKEAGKSGFEGNITGVKTLRDAIDSVFG